MSSFSNLETLITQQSPLSQSAVSNTEFALPQHLTSRLCASPPLVSRPHGWVGPLWCLREYEWSSLLAMHRRVDLDHGNASGLHDRLDSPALGLLSQNCDPSSARTFHFAAFATSIGTLSNARRTDQALAYEPSSL